MSGRKELLSVLSVLALAFAACGGADVGTEVEEIVSTTSPTTIPTTAITETASKADEHSEDHEEDPQHSESDPGSENGQESEMMDGVRVVEVVMTEFAFEPDSYSAAAGETIRFLITNEGVVDHEFRLSNAHRVEEHLASGHADHGEEGGHHDEGGDVYIVVEPGETAELEMTFPEDVSLYTEVACLLPGHYENGMTAPLMVTAS